MSFLHTLFGELLHKSHTAISQFLFPFSCANSAARTTNATIGSDKKVRFSLLLVANINVVQLTYLYVLPWINGAEATNQ